MSPSCRGGCRTPVRCSACVMRWGTQQNFQNQSRIVLNAQRDAAVPGCSTPAALRAAGAQSREVAGERGSRTVLLGRRNPGGRQWPGRARCCSQHGAKSDLPPGFTAIELRTEVKREAASALPRPGGILMRLCEERGRVWRAGRHPAIGQPSAFGPTARREGGAAAVPKRPPNTELLRVLHIGPRHAPSPLPRYARGRTHTKPSTQIRISGGFIVFFNGGSARLNPQEARPPHRHPSAARHPPPRPPFSAAASSGPTRGYAPASLRVAIATAGRPAPAAVRPIGRRCPPSPRRRKGRVLSAGSGAAAPQGVCACAERPPRSSRLARRDPGCGACRPPARWGSPAARASPPGRAATPRSRRSPGSGRGRPAAPAPLPGGWRRPRRFVPPFSRRRRSEAALSNGATPPRRPLRSPRGGRRLPAGSRTGPTRLSHCAAAGRGRAHLAEPRARALCRRPWRARPGRGEEAIRPRGRAEPGSRPPPPEGSSLRDPLRALGLLAALAKPGAARGSPGAALVRVSPLGFSRGDRRNVPGATGEDLISMVLFLILNYSYLGVEVSLGRTAERQKVTSHCPQHVRRLGSNPEPTTLGLIWGMYDQILIGMIGSQWDTVTVRV